MHRPSSGQRKGSKAGQGLSETGGFVYDNLVSVNRYRVRLKHVCLPTGSLLILLLRLSKESPEKCRCLEIILYLCIFMNKASFLFVIHAKNRRQICGSIGGAEKIDKINLWTDEGAENY